MSGGQQTKASAANEPAVTPTANDTAYAELQLHLVDADPIVRGDAIRILAEQIDEPEALELLLSAAADPNPFVRLEVMEALEYAGDENHLEMAAYALQDPYTDVREAAVEALRELGGPDASRILGGVLNDPEVSVREDAVEALRHIGGSNGIAVLEQLTSDPDPAVRELAEEALESLRFVAAQ